MVAVDWRFAVPWLRAALHLPLALSGIITNIVTVTINIITIIITRVITENVAIPAFAMLRPRGGDFVYTKLEQEVITDLFCCHCSSQPFPQVMKRDIESLIESGARVLDSHSVSSSSSPLESFSLFRYFHHLHHSSFRPHCSHHHFGLFD